MSFENQSATCLYYSRHLAFAQLPGRGFPGLSHQISLRVRPCAASAQSSTCPGHANPPAADFDPPAADDPSPDDGF